MEDPAGRAANPAGRLSADHAHQHAEELVDGAVLSDPSYFIAEDNGFRVIADLAKMNFHYLQNMMVSTRSYLRANRDQATRVMRAFVEAIAYFKKNKKDSVQIILKKMRMNPDQAKYASAPTISTPIPISNGSLIHRPAESRRFWKAS